MGSFKDGTEEPLRWNDLRAIRLQRRLRFYRRREAVDCTVCKNEKLYEHGSIVFRFCGRCTHVGQKAPYERLWLCAEHYLSHKIGLCPSILCQVCSASVSRMAMHFHVRFLGDLTPGHLR